MKNYECGNCGKKSVAIMQNVRVAKCGEDDCGCTEVLGVSGPMVTAEVMVRLFQIRNNYKFDCLLENEKSTNVHDNVLKSMANTLHRFQRDWQSGAAVAQEQGDSRLYRALLMAEELAEIMDALVVKDEVELADGLGDLAYVVIGTASTYSIPLSEVFAEIQKANMAKKKRDPKTNPRMRDKGEGWQRPNIKKAIKEGRK